MVSPASLFRRRWRAVRRRADRLSDDSRRARFRSAPLRRDTVFYESFNGNGVLCNPEALFRELLRDSRHSRLRHVWSLSDENDNRRIQAEFAHDRRVRFVTTGSIAHTRALLTSQYLISNATFDRQFARRDGQIYVNTWHGTPLKKMGYDIGDPAYRVANVLRNFLHADVLVSPNDYTSATLFGRAHRLDGVFEGRILEVGSPRIDRQHGGERTASTARDLLRERGLDIDGRRVVLWAPTWKGTSFVAPEDDAAELITRAFQLQEALGPDHVVLLKTHQVVHRFAVGQRAAAGLLVPNDLPTNLVLAASDVLVTDYSSVFFDFLVMRRPIVFFTPDIADYTGYRGLYLEPETWPGPVVRSIADTATEILRLEARGEDLGANHDRMRRELTSHDDGGAARRVIDAVFGGDSRPSDEPRNPGRKRLLAALPSSVSAKRLDEAIDLLDRLDLDGVDVSVVLSDSRQAWYLDAQARIDPRIRQFVRQGRLETPLRAWFRRRAENRRGHDDAHATVAILDRMWNHEWHRIFAGVHFDLVVDLVGTDPFWLTLLQHSHAPTLVWAPEETSDRPDARAGDPAHLRAGFGRIVDARSPAVAATAITTTLGDS
ncbi:MAG: hypothetical protein JWP75_2463 [Frondihabitans sp.]|nr:hypothetical protein [Frondihabitans sp.]